MITTLIQFFLINATLGLVALAVSAAVYDRRQVRERLNDACLLAIEVINYRLETGYYSYDVDTETLEKDFDQQVHTFLHTVTS